MSDEGGGFAFVDSNILIYAHDESAGIKREAASAIIERLWEERSGRLSVQVLQEFFVNATARSGKRKSGEPLDAREAREVVEDYSRWEVHRPGADDVLAAIDIHQRMGISFWDAMIVQSASSQGCEVLYSEDLNDGQIYEGVRLENPFAPDRLLRRRQNSADE
jgi:predicted nucleic acid-binding protein